MPTPTDKSALLSDISPYVYGTTRLGDDKLLLPERIKIARAAMNAVDWFHTSHTYGNALEVLRMAFDQDRTRVPKLIVKIGWNTLPELRSVIEQNIEPLAVDAIELGQLCLNGELAEQFANGGDCYRAFEDIKKQGLVRRFVLEVFPWTSQTALKALRAGYTKGIVDGFIFYLNPLQRFASNELWDLLLERQEPVIAMRTVSGGNVYRLRDVPRAAWKDYLQQRAVEVAPIFERSGIAGWAEFCVRLAHSYPTVRATVGATANLENLKELTTAAQNPQPLPQDILDEFNTLQRRWSDELDVVAEPWSM